MWIHPKSHVFTLSCSSVQSQQKKSQNIISTTIIAILGNMANIFSAICAPVQPKSKIIALLNLKISCVPSKDVNRNLGRKSSKRFLWAKIAISANNVCLSDQSFSIDINFSIGFVIAAEVEFTIGRLLMVMMMMTMAMMMMMMMDPTFAFHRDFL